MTVEARTRPVQVAGGVVIGGGAPLALIGGPCAIEDERHALMMAERLRRISDDAKMPFIYKSSYDKANRSSVHSYRGPGLEKGLEILGRVGRRWASFSRRPRRLRGGAAAGCSTCSGASFPLPADGLLLLACGGTRICEREESGFSPADMADIVEKIQSTATRRSCSRSGAPLLGHNNPWSTSMGSYGGFGCPVIFDATHSVSPAGRGRREGRAGTNAGWRGRGGVGVDALFMEFTTRIGRCRIGARSRTAEHAAARRPAAVARRDPRHRVGLAGVSGHPAYQVGKSSAMTDRKRLLAMPDRVLRLRPRVPAPRAAR